MGIEECHGYHGRAENEVGAPGAAQSALGLKGEITGRKRVSGGSRVGESPWSGLMARSAGRSSCGGLDAAP